MKINKKRILFGACVGAVIGGVIGGVAFYLNDKIYDPKDYFIVDRKNVQSMLEGVMDIACGASEQAIFDKLEKEGIDHNIVADVSYTIPHFNIKFLTGKVTLE
jgi:hypothetical protein